MATGTTPDSEIQHIIDTLYAGKAVTLCLTTASTWAGKTVTMPQFLASELPVANGYGRQTLTFPASVQDNTNVRYTVTSPNATFTASGLSLVFDGVVALMASGALSPAATASKLITACDFSDNSFTCNGHGLSNNDRLIITTDSPGTNPGGVSPSTLYYAIVVDSNTFRISTTSGGSAVDVTTIGSIGTQPTRLRYGNGRIIQAYKLPASRTILSGQSQPIPLSLATLNIGYARGI